MTLQSTLALEPDTTLAPLAALIFADVATRTRLFATASAVALGGVAVALVAWAKIYDVVPAIVALAVTAAVRVGVGAAIVRVAAVVGGAVSLSALVWIPPAGMLDMPVAQRLRYLPGVIADRLGGDGDALALPKTAIQLVLWLSPVAVGAAAAVAILGLAIRRAATAETTFVALWAALHVAAFGVGLLYGFPKYHAPVVAFIVLGGLAAVRWAPGAGAGPVCRGVVLGVAAGLAVAALAGDPLHAARTELKQTTLLAPHAVPGAAVTVLMRAAAYVVVPIAAAGVLCALGRVGRSTVGVVATLLAAHASLSAGLLACQAVADYATRYRYGERGLADVVDLLRRGGRRGAVLAPLPVTEALGLAPSYGMPAFWRGEDGALVPAAGSPTTAAVVFSMGHHELRQLRYLTADPALASAFAEGGYRRHEIGTFVVWYRPSGAP